MICKYIIKRNGRKTNFDEGKVFKGVFSAYHKADPELDGTVLTDLASETFDKVSDKLDERGFDCIIAEDLQKIVISALKENGIIGKKAASEFQQYADARREQRELLYLKGALKTLTTSSAKDSDIKRENANVDGDTAMGTMLKYGSESAKSYNLSEILPKDQADAHINGDIHIHDLDFLTLTETCCQIPLDKLFKKGFSTGHGYVREPNGIASALSLAAIAIQSNQNDQHGGQAIPCFDYYLAPYVAKEAKKQYMRCFSDALANIYDDGTTEYSSKVENVGKAIDVYLADGKSLLDEVQIVSLVSIIDSDTDLNEEQVMRICKRAVKYTERATYQAMEGFIHNLNTMNSRAGAQVPFSSINFGTDTSLEGRMISRNLMSAVYAGLGNGETPIFPISIFKIKSGVNFEPDSPNYDLYQQALRTTAKRLFPNFAFIDAPFNLQYYRPGCPETEVAYMGCRTRVMGNTYDTSREITAGRGNLSFTSINLPRLGILSKGDLAIFMKLLDERLQLVKEQLLFRFDIQCSKTVKNYPFLMGQGVWIDSEKLYTNDSVRDVLKHGTLTIGFIGLAECLVALCGQHHGASETAQELGLRIVKHMREFTDKLCEETGLNWSVIGTPAEGLAGRFVKLDRKLFGEIPGVTDKDWYTNSFHVPVEYELNAFKKIKIEAPYHALTNGGHISYIELNGDVSNNIEALDKIVHCMADSGIGYGAINHPVDRDPVCGYIGIIGDECPLCKRKEKEMTNSTLLTQLLQVPESHSFTPAERGKGVSFERIRRITGYLVGTLDRFNDAKRAEVEHRAKHL